MKGKFFFAWFIFLSTILNAQDERNFKFYLGVSYGTSFAVGNFADTDPNNPNAGFADHGRKIDFYAGYFLNKKFTLNGDFRYQFYETNIDNVVNEYNTENPGANLTAESEKWETFYFLVGLSYLQDITKKFHLYPRVALGPMLVSNPAITGVVNTGDGTYNLERSSEVALGLGFEVGVGLRTKLGRHFTLMPTYDFSGGFVSIADVESTNNNISELNDYRPKIRSINLGLSIAYKFY